MHYCYNNPYTYFISRVKFNEVDADYQAQLNGIPNVIFDDVPEGGEEDSVEIKAWGEKKSGATDHLD